MMRKNNRLRKRSGLAVMEYGLMGSLVAVAAILSVSNLGTHLSSMYCHISNSVGLRIGLGSANCASGGIASTYYGVGYLGSLNVAGGKSCGNICSSSDITSIDAQTLADLNKLSPITSFYGLVDSSTGKTVSSLDQAYDAVNLNGNGSGDVVTPNGDHYHYEAQTADGNTYGFFTSNNSMGYRNLATGQTYFVDASTGQVINEGVTTGDLDYKNRFN